MIPGMAGALVADSKMAGDISFVLTLEMVHEDRRSQAEPGEEIRLGFSNLAWIYVV